MRGGQGRQPLDVPSMEGLAACSLECLACLNHVHGWTIWGGYGTLPSNPAFVASDRSQVARRRVRLDLVTSGSLNSNSTRARTSLVPSLCPVVMHSPVTGLFRVLLDRFLLPTIRPRFQEQTYDWAYPIGSPFSIAMYGVTDSCAKTLGKYCSCTSASVGRAFSAPPLDDMRSI